MTCIGKDTRCPCQDGDACHYKDCKGTKAQPPLPVQEPVACRFCHDARGCWTWQCYKCGEIDDVQQPAAQRKPLTDEEIARTAAAANIEFDADYSLSDQTIYYIDAASLMGFARAIEVAHGIKEKT